ncbi:hypothetical protein CaCOL14_005855 [Colletotrichum acutatum]
MPQYASVKDFESGHYDQQEPVELQIHSNLTSSSQLLRALERRLPSGSYTVEMRHNIYTVRVDSQRAPSESSMLKASKYRL